MASFSAARQQMAALVTVRRSDVEVLTFSGTANRSLMVQDGEEFTSAISDRMSGRLASL